MGEWSTSGDDGEGNHWYLAYTAVVVVRRVVVIVPAPPGVRHS
jgi:hypothetical protein